MRWPNAIAAAIAAVALLLPASASAAPHERATGCDLFPNFPCEEDSLFGGIGDLLAIPSGPSRDHGQAGGGHRGQNAPGQRHGGGGGARNTLAELYETKDGTIPADSFTLPNPICTRGVDRGRAGANCEASGQPDSSYPLSNYQLDFWGDDSGSIGDQIVGNAAKAFGALANAIWIVWLWVVHGVLTVLGWALAFNPLEDHAFMGELGRGLESFYRAFTDPLLTTAFAALGTWVLWRGLVRRQGGPAVAGTLLAVAAMLASWVMIHEPDQTVGRLSAWANDVAVGLVAAPQGELRRPRQGYAEATEELWRGVVYPVFAVLNFSDPQWALDAYQPDSERSPQSDTVEASLPAGVPAPDQNLEAWLAFPYESEERQRMFQNVAEEGPDDIKGAVAMQNNGHQTIRLPMVLLLIVGVLGLLFLLGWLCLRLFLAASIAFILLMAAPFAMLMPAFGEAGRKAWTGWITTLAGAVLAKLLYSALLAIVIFGTLLIGRQVGSAGGLPAILGIVILSAFWWSAFLKRNDVLRWVSLSDDGDRLGAAGTLGGLYFGARMAGMAKRGIARGGGALRQRWRDRYGTPADAEAGTQAGAQQALAERSRELGNQRYAQDSRIASAQHSRKHGLGELTRRRREAEAEAATHSRAAADHDAQSGRHRAQAARADPIGARAANQQAAAHDEASRRSTALAVGARQRAARLGAQQAAAQAEITANAPRAERAEHFVAETDRARAAGAPFSERQQRELEDGLRASLDRPTDHAVHGWRAGMSEDEYGELMASTDRRDAARKTDAYFRVGRSLEADRKVFAAIPDSPMGAPRTQRQLRDSREVYRQRHGDGALYRHVDAQRRRRVHERRRRERYRPRPGEFKGKPL